MMQKARSAQTISSREFNQDVGKAKRAAESGPVIVTDRGRPAYVLLKHAEYQRLTSGGRGETLFDLLAQDGPDADFEFDPPRLGGSLLRPIDLD